VSGTSPDSVQYPIVGYGVAVPLDEGTGTYNYAVLTESDTGQPVRLLAKGVDANIPIEIVPKGTGTVIWRGASSFGTVSMGTDRANFGTFTGANNTGVFDTAAPVLAAAGAGTHIDLKALGKGANGRLNTTKLYVGPASARAFVDDRQISDFRANIIWSTTPVPAYRWGGNAAGTITSGTADFGLFAIDTDTADPTGGSGPSGITGFRVGHNLTGGAGGRTALSAGLNITGAFTASEAGSGSFQVAGGFRAQASASAGGTAGFGNQRGNLFGINPIVEIKTGAGLHWQSLIGGEISVAAETGTGINYKVGWQVVQFNSDQVSGSGGEDAGFLLGNSVLGTPAVGWNIGYCFGSKWTWWPIKSTGTMIGTGTSFAGGPAYTAAWGVDFNAVTFSSGAFRSPGFLVSGSGVTTMASAVIGTSGPTIRAGTGAASGTQPRGSLWLRSDGGVGTTLYVSQGGGTWNAVAGV
jgi:hypothetical protein